MLWHVKDSKLHLIISLEQTLSTFCSSLFVYFCIFLSLTCINGKKKYIFSAPLIIVYIFKSNSRLSKGTLETKPTFSRGEVDLRKNALIYSKQIICFPHVILGSVPL